jgi:acyl-CoA thioesterase
MFAAIDTAMGAAVTSVLSPEELCFTIEAKVNYIAAVTGGSLTVEAEVVHKGGRVAVLEGRARTEDGRLAALMTASFVIGRRERV